MKVKYFEFFGILTSSMIASTVAFAFDDGVYKAVDRKGNCSSTAEVTVYVEGDRPINLSLIPGGTGMMQDPQKITSAKTKMTMRGESSVFQMEFWKIKNNQFNVKILSGSECDGIQLTFAK